MVLSLLALVGCHGEPDATPPKRPRPRLGTVPHDMTSAVGVTPLRVVMDNGSLEVPAALLEPIAAQVRLVSWPEGAPVAVTTQLQAFAASYGPSGFPVFDMGTITVTPVLPLEDRWYFLHLPSVPAGVDVAGTMQVRRLSDGRVGTRFTVASDPRMTWIRRCVIPGTPGKVVVDFSEVVALDSADALTVDASGRCQRAVGSNGADLGMTFSFACSGLTTGTPVRVFVASTVTGIGGRPVRGGGRAIDIPSTSFQLGSECPMADLSE